MKTVSRARLLPFMMLVLGVIALLKISNVWFGLSAASATQDAILMEELPETESAEIETSAPDVPKLAEGEVERRMLEKLAARRLELEAREEKIKAREALLAATESRLEMRIAYFEQQQALLREMQDVKDEQEAQDIEALVSAYEKMKAKDAAAIFNALDDSILLSVASGMRTQALAGVLAEMQPDRARLLTIMLAEKGKAALAQADKAQ